MLVDMRCVWNMVARSIQACWPHLADGCQVRHSSGAWSWFSDSSVALKQMPSNICPPMRVHLRPSDTAPAGPAGPAGPARPSGPTGPTSPCGPAGPAAPLGPCGPVAPIGPGAPCIPLGPCRPGSPLRPLSPFIPLNPRGPCGPMGPVEFSFWTMAVSSTMSSFLSASFISKRRPRMSSLSFFILSTPFSISSSFFSSARSSRLRTWAFSLTMRFCFLAASTSSTGHIGQPSGTTATSPNRMMVGGGAGGGGRVWMRTCPMGLPSGPVTSTEPIGGTFTYGMPGGWSGTCILPVATYCGSCCKFASWLKYS
mmetsp:Transcript_60503/g.126620  ORF Transcript_60503/g.126620 Transcript_60503/m.126620 type:complete len:311 (-) Transcript_60503:172-1104(-)